MNEYSNAVRREDRQQSNPSFLKSLLQSSVSCSIAIQREGYPLNHLAFFAYDEAPNEIIFHFSKYGFAGKEIIDGKKVCVSVSKYGKLYTAKRAVDFGCEYQSVIAYRRIQILTSDEERIAAMRLFFEKFFAGVPKDSYKDFNVHDAQPIHVARIKIDDWFGKEHRVPGFAISSFYPSPDPVITS